MIQPDMISLQLFWCLTACYVFGCPSSPEDKNSDLKSKTTQAASDSDITKTTIKLKTSHQLETTGPSITVTSTSTSIIEGSTPETTKLSTETTTIKKPPTEKTTTEQPKCKDDQNHCENNGTCFIDCSNGSFPMCEKCKCAYGWEGGYCQSSTMFLVKKVVMKLRNRWCSLDTNTIFKVEMTQRNNRCVTKETKHKKGQYNTSLKEKI